MCLRSGYNHSLEHGAVPTTSQEGKLLKGFYSWSHFITVWKVYHTENIAILLTRFVFVSTSIVLLVLKKLMVLILTLFKFYSVKNVKKKMTSNPC